MKKFVEATGLRRTILANLSYSLSKGIFMADPSPVFGTHISDPRHQQHDHNKFMGVTLRGWAISTISSIAVLTAVGTGLVTVYGKYQSLASDVEKHKAKDVELVSRDLELSTQLQTVAKYTGEKLTEADKHLQNHDRFESVPIETDPEIVTADYYPSDGCVHVTRKSKASNATSGKSQNVFYGNDQDVWITDIQQKSDTASTTPDQLDQAHPGEKSDARHNLPSHKQRDSLLRLISQTSTHVDWSDSPKPIARNILMYQGSCLNPHPGSFTTSNVQVNACLVQVWRHFNDGCTHSQMYNACNGQWDPHINWTFCATQHHP